MVHFRCNKTTTVDSIVLFPKNTTGLDDRRHIVIMNLKLSFFSLTDTYITVLMNNANNSAVLYRQRVKADSTTMLDNIITARKGPFDEILVQSNASNVTLVQSNQPNSTLNQSNLSNSTLSSLNLLQNSSASLLYVSDDSRGNGFSAFLNKDVEITVSEDFRRIDGWSSQSTVGYYDTSSGFKDERGVFVAEESGDYLLSVIMETNNMKGR